MTLLTISYAAFSLPGLNVLAWLPVLAVVIFIHELGHFLVARWCGVKVDTFSIGFGPELASFPDSHGTRWRIAAIPLGGYVKFMDDENGASMPARERLAKMTPEQRAGAFQAKPLWQRAAVVAAGPAANFLSAILMFAVVAYVLGIEVKTPPQIEPTPDGPAARAGLKAGDVITGIDGSQIKEFSGLLRLVSGSNGRELTIDVLRDGTPLSFKVLPEQKTLDDGFGGKDTRPVIGVKLTQVKGEVIQPSIPGAIVHGAYLTWQVISDTVNAMLHWSFFQKVGGLPTMIDVSNKVATYGLIPLIQLTGILSVSIGFINLLPIPILDGGHLMFYAAEAVRGRPLSEQAQEFGYRIGFALVASLMLLALWNDRFRICQWFSPFLGVNCYG